MSSTKVFLIWLLIVALMNIQHINRVEYLQDLGANDSTRVLIQVKLNGYGKIELQAAPTYKDTTKKKPPVQDT